MKRYLDKYGFFYLLTAAMLCSCLVCWLCYRYDNKYTQPRPAAYLGVTQLSGEWLQQHPFFYLADGWSFYQNKLLTPTEIAAHTPDAYLYLGQYGGFELGDSQGDPHGQATYRTVVLLDGQPRDYALESTQIFSSWRLWVNGQLLQSVGFGDPEPPRPDNRLVQFRATDKIEIVVQVKDDSGFYSGLVYPPALGSPEAVGRVSSLRLLFHALFCGAALLLGFLCLLVGAARGFGRPYAALALLCLCFCGATIWPVYQALGLYGAGWALLERLCYYGIFLALIWIQGKMCALPRKALWPALGAGLLVCLSVLLQPLFRVESAAPLWAYSQALGAYKWLVALWLLATGLWALRRRVAYSRTLLVAGCMFACTLVMDQLLPLHEPVLLGWFVENIGWVLILLFTGVLWHDAVRVYRERAQLQARQVLAEAQLNARAEQARLQQQYVRRTQKQLHESRNRLTLIRHYLDSGQLAQLNAYLEEITPAIGAGGAGEYTGHSLTDAILSVQLAQAAALDIYVQYDFDQLPDCLPLKDEDLTSLLMNLLDNALEACARLADSADRWLVLSLGWQPGRLSLECANAAPPPAAGRSSKGDRLAHGYGLEVVEELVAKYNGTMEIDQQTDSYAVEVGLCLTGEEPEKLA